MKLLIATHNTSKFERYKTLLHDFPQLDIVSLKDLGIREKVEEPFGTAMENAIHKARQYCRISGMATLAIDESALTNFLPDNEQPGVYVRRNLNSNVERTDEETLVFWKKVFEKYPQKNKEFTWDFSIAYVDPVTNVLYSAQAVQVDTITETFSHIIHPGYPMSSFLVPKGLTTPYTELTDAEKLFVDRQNFRAFLQAFPTWIPDYSSN